MTDNHNTEIPWNEGAEKELFDRMAITMTHDELVSRLGEHAKFIENAGFVLVPREWQRLAMAAVLTRSTENHD